MKHLHFYLIIHHLPVYLNIPFLFIDYLFYLYRLDFHPFYLLIDRVVIRKVCEWIIWQCNTGIPNKKAKFVSPGVFRLKDVSKARPAVTSPCQRPTPRGRPRRPFFKAPSAVNMILAHAAFLHVLLHCAGLAGNKQL